MLDDPSVPEVFLGAGLQLVVISICVMVFIYVRFALGPRGRYAIHLAASWALMGLVYALYAGVVAVLHEAPSGDARDIWSVISSTLSLISSGFLIASWYMMRDDRLDVDKSHSPSPLPTMSKPFVSQLLIALNATVAAYMGLVRHTTASAYIVQRIFVVVDVTAACVGCILVGSELLQMRLIYDTREGSLFPEDWSHRWFRRLAFLLFLSWGLMQYGVVPGLWSVGEDSVSPFFRFPCGGWYTWLGIMKLLCGTTAAVLIMHAIPNVRWHHAPVTPGNTPAAN